MANPQFENYRQTGADSPQNSNLAMSVPELYNDLPGLTSRRGTSDTASDQHSLDFPDIYGNDSTNIQGRMATHIQTPTDKTHIQSRPDTTHIQADARHIQADARHIQADATHIQAGAAARDTVGSAGAGSSESFEGNLASGASNGLETTGNLYADASQVIAAVNNSQAFDGNPVLSAGDVQTLEGILQASGDGSGNSQAVQQLVSGIENQMGPVESNGSQEAMAINGSLATYVNLGASLSQGLSDFQQSGSNATGGDALNSILNSAINDPSLGLQSQINQELNMFQNSFGDGSSNNGTGYSGGGLGEGGSNSGGSYGGGGYGGGDTGGGSTSEGALATTGNLFADASEVMSAVNNSNAFDGNPVLSAGDMQTLEQVLQAGGDGSGNSNAVQQLVQSIDNNMGSLESADSQKAMGINGSLATFMNIGSALQQGLSDFQQNGSGQTGGDAINSIVNQGISDPGFGLQEQLNQELAMFQNIFGDKGTGS